MKNNDDDNWLLFIEVAIHCPKHFTRIMSFDPHNSSMKEVFFHWELTYRGIDPTAGEN